MQKSACQAKKSNIAGAQWLIGHFFLRRLMPVGNVTVAPTEQCR